MRRLLARAIEALARLGDPTACRFANDTHAAWDDFGYHVAPTPPPSQENA